MDEQDSVRIGWISPRRQSGARTLQAGRVAQGLRPLDTAQPSPELQGAKPNADAGSKNPCTRGQASSGRAAGITPVIPRASPAMARQHPMHQNSRRHTRAAIPRGGKTPAPIHAAIRSAPVCATAARPHAPIRNVVHESVASLSLGNETLARRRHPIRPGDAPRRAGPRFPSRLPLPFPRSRLPWRRTRGGGTTRQRTRRMPVRLTYCFAPFPEDGRRPTGGGAPS
jgi:hypothetical protein